MSILKKILFLYLFTSSSHTFPLYLQSTGSGSTGFTAGQYSEAETSADNKMALTDFGSFRSVVRG